MSLKLHERYFIVRKAHNELMGAALEVMKRHELTALEWTGLFIEIAGHEFKYALRAERHPDDPEKKADEE